MRHGEHGELRRQHRDSLGGQGLGLGQVVGGYGLEQRPLAQLGRQQILQPGRAGGGATLEGQRHAAQGQLLHRLRGWQDGLGRQLPALVARQGPGDASLVVLQPQGQTHQAACGAALFGRWQGVGRVGGRPLADEAHLRDALQWTLQRRVVAQAVGHLRCLLQEARDRIRRLVGVRDGEDLASRQLGHAGQRRRPLLAAAHVEQHHGGPSRTARSRDTVSASLASPSLQSTTTVGW